MEILLNEGRNAGEHPCSIADAQARVGETIALVEAAASNVLDVDPATPIAHALPMGMVFDLTAEQYARDWALPQFYFHVMAIYAILRAERIDLGKADYVAHMFAYLRPGTGRANAHQTAKPTGSHSQTIGYLIQPVPDYSPCRAAMAQSSSIVPRPTHSASHPSTASRSTEPSPPDTAN